MTRPIPPSGYRRTSPPPPSLGQPTFALDDSFFSTHLKMSIVPWQLLAIDCTDDFIGVRRLAQLEDFYNPPGNDNIDNGRHQS